MTSIDSHLLTAPARLRAPRAADEIGETPVTIGDLAEALAKRIGLLPRWLFLTLALAALYILISPTRYNASMSILIDPTSRPPAITDILTPMPPADEALTESQMRLITSNEVLRRVADKERLDHDPDFMASQLASILSALQSLIREKSSHLGHSRTKSSERSRKPSR